MARNNASFVRIVLVIGIVILLILTYRNYHSAISTLQNAEELIMKEEEESNKFAANEKGLIDKDAIKKVEDDWEREMQLLDGSNIDFNENECGLKTRCDSTREYSYRVISGAANVIGPRICWGGSDILRSKLNNVDRGMNVVVVNLEGKSPRHSTFDLYGKDSTDLKAFLNLVKPGEIVMVASYDDAAFRLDGDARGILNSFGSQFAKEIAFRDGWVFLGAKNIPDFIPTETHIKNNKDANKYGDWPEAIEISGCVPHPGSISQQ